MPRSMCLCVSRGTATGFRHVRSRRRLFPAARPHWCTHTRPCPAARVCRPFLKPVLSLLSHKRQCLSSKKPCLPYVLVREKILLREMKPIRQVVSWASLQSLICCRFPIHALDLKALRWLTVVCYKPWLFLADSSQVLSYLVMKRRNSWSLKYQFKKRKHLTIYLSAFEAFSDKLSSLNVSVVSSTVFIWL